MEILEMPLRAGTEAIDRILSALINMCLYIFRNNGFMVQLIDTITGNSFLLISVSMVLCGFVIGLISRLIRI